MNIVWTPSDVIAVILGAAFVLFLLLAYVISALVAFVEALQEKRWWK